MILKLNNRHRLLKTFAALFYLSLLLVIPAPTPTTAHGYMIRSVPASGAVLSQSPTRIQVWFTENLEPKFSTLMLSDQHGRDIPLTESGLSANSAAQLTARIPSKLPNGAYIVTLRAAFASDGHVATDTFVFWVGEQSGNVSTVGLTQDVQPLEVSWRFLSIAAFNILFGATFLYQFVLLPSWGNVAYRAGKLPPRIMGRLNILMWGAIVIALTATALALLQQASILFSTDIVSVLRNNTWPVVLSGTQFGQVITLRIVLLGLVIAIHAGTLYLVSRQPDFVSLLWALNTVVTGAMLGTLSASSHAAGSTLWPIGAVLVDWLHLLANGVWVGGLLTLVAILPTTLAPLASNERHTALKVVLRRFSGVGTNSLVLLIVTGIFSALLHVRQTSDLTSTNYGITLAAKIILILPLLAAALYHHLISAPGRFTQFAMRLQIIERFEKVASSLRIESGLAITVTLFAALLATTPPPIPPEAQLKLQAPTQVVSVDNVQVTLVLDPGAVGPNTYEVRLARQSEPIRGAFVSVQFALPLLDKRGNWLALDDAGDGSYLGAGPDLERTGRWLALVDIAGIDNNAIPQRTVFEWNVPDVAPTPTTRQALSINWLSVIGILGAVAVLTLPGIMGIVRGLDLQTESVIIGIAALVATIILLVGGAWFMADAYKRSDQLSNPIPSVVNPIIPDAASVLAGKQLYERSCVECHGENGKGNLPLTATNIPPDLTRRLPTRRDEELFNTIARHKGLNIQLTETEVWQVVNYLRTTTFLRKESQR